MSLDRFTSLLIFKYCFASRNMMLVFDVQADRGFARSRLCTDEDGTTNNLVLYMVQNDTSKKGGDAPRATD